MHEVTLRTPVALGAIRQIAALADPDIVVGAGSVTTIEQCREAVRAGAQFIVSPGFCEEVVKFCVEHGVDVIPGCVTPTEIIKAVACGINTVKFFPANIYGGLSAMKALNGPFPRVSFVPTRRGQWGQSQGIPESPIYSRSGWKLDLQQEGYRKW